MRNLIEVVRRHAWLDFRGDEIEDFTCELCTVHQHMDPELRSVSKAVQVLIQMAEYVKVQ
jgi:hypothetical protein